jgi:hypothetical protein
MRTQVYPQESLLQSELVGGDLLDEEGHFFGAQCLGAWVREQY